MSTQTGPARGERITFPPAAIHIEAELFVDTVAELLAARELLEDLYLGQETETSRRIGERADLLLNAVAPVGGGLFDYRSPFAVEACARAKELLAGYYDHRPPEPGALRNAAHVIRSYQHVFASYMEPQELAGLEGVGDAS